MEGKVVEEYKQKGFKIFRKVVSPNELLKAETILVTNSLIGAVSISIHFCEQKHSIPRGNCYMNDPRTSSAEE